MIVDIPTYRDITGDWDTPDDLLTPRLERAQKRVEEYLGRELDSTERTEVVGVSRDGYAYPSVWPVTAVPADYTIRDTRTVYVGTGSLLVDLPAVALGEGTWVTLTYTGGFTTATAPTALVEAVCAVAKPDPTRDAIPAGATSVRSGDQSVTFAEGAPALAEPILAKVRPWRRRSV